MTMSVQRQLNAVAQLPKSTIRLLASSQVITSVSSVVKELMENALDAGAASIDIRLEKHGLEKIEVKDDGCGVREADCTCMALPHYTSKLKSFSDLDELDSYGFRGEALHSVCSVASVCITTRTNDDTTARRYKLDKCGQPVDFETVHGLKGTTVTVTDLFKNLPVRRQVMSCTKRMNEELKIVENIVKSLSVINPGVRVSLAHNKCLIWQKTAVKDLRLSVIQVFSYNLSKHLHHIVHHSNKVELEMLVPKHDCDIKSLCSGTGTEAYHLFISKRPVKDKDIEKVLSEVLSRSFGNDIPPNKSILCIVAITLPPDRLDINLEPNKTKIFIKDKEEILSSITDQLDSYYSQAVSASKVENTVPVHEPKPKRKRMEEPKINGGVEKSALVNFTPEIPLLNQELSDSTKQNNFTPSQPNSEQHTNFKQLISVSVENRNIGNDFSLKNTNLEREIIGTEQKVLQESDYEQLDEVSPSLHNESESSFFEKTSSPRSEFTHNDLSISKDALPQPNNIIQNVTLENNYGLSNKKIDASIFLPQKVGRPTVEPLGNQNEEYGDMSGETRELLKDFLDMEEKSSQMFEKNQFQMLNEEQHNIFDNPSLSQWSKGGLISVSGAKIMGSCVLKQSSIQAIKEHQSEKFLVANTDSYIETTEKFNPTMKNDTMLHQEPIPPRTELFSPENDYKPSVTNGSDEGVVKRQSTTEFANNSFSDDNKSVEFERSVSSQMGNKQMSGFTAFARQMRSEILKESPGMSFTAVAGILASKWRSLQEYEKDRYNSIASSNKKKKKLKTVERDVKKESIKSSFCETPKLERNFIVSEASMELLSGASLDLPVENSHSSVVGRIESSDLWICTRICQQEIGLINSQLLDEAYRFKQNVDLMEIPLKPLGRSIAVSPRFLTENLWEVLLSLESVTDTSGEEILITDKRIVKNGFRIRIISKEENVCAYLTDLALHVIDLYGVHDLQMTLELIEKHGVDHCTLAQSRCPNVIKYIRSETSRQCVQMMNRDKLNDAHELENRLRMLENDKSTCWESFYKALHVLQ